jgi:uncharacterized protein YoxC
MSDRLAHVKDNMIDSKDQLVKGVKEKTDVMLGQAIEGLDHQIEALGERLETLTADVRRRLSTVDTHLHEKPYLYLLGASIAGLGIGLFLKARASRDS